MLFVTSSLCDFYINVYTVCLIVLFALTWDENLIIKTVLFYEYLTRKLIYYSVKFENIKNSWDILHFRAL